MLENAARREAAVPIVQCKVLVLVQYALLGGISMLYNIIRLLG
jgi:hypothetical protein